MPSSIDIEGYQLVKYFKRVKSAYAFGWFCSYDGLSCAPKISFSGLPPNSFQKIFTNSFN